MYASLLHLEMLTVGMSLAKRLSLAVAESLQIALDFRSLDIPPTWEFYCDDTHWLKNTGDYTYWDTRERERGGQVTREMSNFQGSCMDDEIALIAYLT